MTQFDHKYWTKLITMIQGEYDEELDGQEIADVAIQIGEFLMDNRIPLKLGLCAMTVLMEHAKKISGVSVSVLNMKDMTVN